MGKKEVYTNVLGEVNALFDKHNVKEAVRVGILEIIERNVAPKAAGAAVDLETVVKRDEAGNITHIKCQVSGVFLPAEEKYFYTEKNGTGVGGTGFRRLSRLGEKARKDFDKAQREGHKQITFELLEGTLSPEEGKKRVEELTSRKPDFSTVVEFEDTPAADPASDAGNSEEETPAL
ncbi:MAG: hypothetical protein RBT33_00945 [Candidatus Dojkabacteria bacterium]|jgi:hypothetical protein|nr:hypothetical protein [Candidatus Dojkabacteria bacterium]MDX9738920.1 hypothetical protein [Candidatus Dojkabacteria bacterium]